MAKKPIKPMPDLPPDVKESDKQYPKKGIEYKEREALGLDYESGFNGNFTFYKTIRFGWVLTTLHISKGKQATERYYGITTDGKDALVTVGRGPHVLATAVIYLSKDNLKRLTKYIELWKKGVIKAGETRDSISSKRANTAMRRANNPLNAPWYS